MKVIDTEIADVKIIEPDYRRDDVAVDIRKGSPTYGQYVACYLYADDSEFAKRQAAAFGIVWPEMGLPLTLSEKDQRHPLFKEIEAYE